MADFYAEVAAIYDRMIRWERRLQVETPLFAALWARTGARSVLDAACGSGRHLELFRAQGLAATGADASPEMLALARARLAGMLADRRPQLIQAAWADLPAKVPGRFDAVLCLGNSLPYVTDPAERRASLAGMLSKVAPGGFLLIQFRNFARMRAKDERFLPLSQTVDREAGVEHVCLRQYGWRRAAVDFTVTILTRALGDPEAAWTLRHWTTQLATLAAGPLARELRGLGATVRAGGSLALEPYDAAASDDVVLLAFRND